MLHLQDACILLQDMVLLQTFIPVAGPVCFMPAIFSCPASSSSLHFLPTRMTHFLKEASKAFCSCWMCSKYILYSRKILYWTASPARMCTPSPDKNTSGFCITRIYKMAQHTKSPPHMLRKFSLYRENSKDIQRGRDDILSGLILIW